MGCCRNRFNRIMQNTLQWKHLLDLDVIILEMLLLFSIFSYLVSIRMPVQSQFRASGLRVTDVIQVPQT